MARSGCYIHVWTLFVDKLWVSGTVLFVAGWVLVAVPPSSSPCAIWWVFRMYAGFLRQFVGCCLSMVCILPHAHVLSSSAEC